MAPTATQGEEGEDETSALSARVPAGRRMTAPRESRVWRMSAGDLEARGRLDDVVCVDGGGKPV